MRARAAGIGGCARWSYASQLLVECVGRRLGGALARADEAHGAAGHVEEPYLLIYGGVVAAPELADPIAGLIARVNTAMGPYRAGRTVPNFAADAESAYPPDALARLAAIKRQRDPKGVIRSNRPVSRL